MAPRAAPAVSFPPAPVRNAKQDGEASPAPFFDQNRLPRVCFAETDLKQSSPLRVLEPYSLA
jgi:hypothetical protein